MDQQPEEPQQPHQPRKRPRRTVFMTAGLTASATVMALNLSLQAPADNDYGSDAAGDETTSAAAPTDT